MDSIIYLYAYSVNMLTETINEIIDNTIMKKTKIILCKDADFEFEHEDVTIYETNRVGRAKAWQIAFDNTDSEVCVFMRAPVKVSCDWFQRLSKHLSDNNIITPNVHALDTQLWTAEPNCFTSVSMRWDLDHYDKRNRTTGVITPLVTSYCLMIKRSWLNKIGGWDTEMLPGRGEDTEISIRNSLMGGANVICDSAQVSVDFEIDASPETINNKARIASVWFGKYSSRIANKLNIDISQINIGKTNRLNALKEMCVHDINWWIKTHIPECDQIYDLQNIALGKRIVIVAPGKSIDYIPNYYISDHDIIIGIDYAGLIYDCDYVITDSVIVLAELKTKYKNDNFILPRELENRMAGAYIQTTEIADIKYQFERLPKNAIPTSIEPPICDFDTNALTAIHMALFMRPKSITLVGQDNGLINGKSHTERSDFYNKGEIWPDTEATRRMYTFNEHCLSILSRLASEQKIPLIRINHA